MRTKEKDSQTEMKVLLKQRTDGRETQEKRHGLKKRLQNIDLHVLLTTYEPRRVSTGRDESSVLDSKLEYLNI